MFGTYIPSFSLDIGDFEPFAQKIENVVMFGIRI